MHMSVESSEQARIKSSLFYFFLKSLFQDVATRVLFGWFPAPMRKMLQLYHDIEASM
jgi:hypothetical protein